MTGPRRITVLDAPSNLGLRPPAPESVPGCYKAPGMLRDRRLLSRLGAGEGGVVTPPRYSSAWTPGTVRNEEGIARFTEALAARTARAHRAGDTLLVLGGDCSVLLGPALALSRTGRFGYAYLDAHLDFRHPGNSDAVGAAAGEALALLTGRGGRLAGLERTRPYARGEDVVAIGCRPGDEYTDEAREAGIHLLDARVVGQDPAGAADAALTVLSDPALDGFWIHLDVDVLDERVMSAVDSPEPAGLDWAELTILLGGLLGAPRVVGLDVCIYDPDLDPDGEAAAGLVDVLVGAFEAARGQAAV